MECKDNWFIDAYNNNKLKYVIAGTHRNFGVVKEPTGYGKSGVIFEDIVHNILNKNPERKLIICICSHQLNLNEQTFNSFFNVLKGCRGLLDGHKTCLFLNSSSSERNYSDMTFSTSTNIYKGVDELVKFHESDYDIAFVSSCNKSLHKFINCDIDGSVEIVTYIDECHSVVDSRSSFSYNINLERLARRSKKLYGLSATPSYFVSMFNAIINKYGLNGRGVAMDADECLVDVSPTTAIEENVIVKPYVKFVKTNVDTVNAQVVVECMGDARRSGNVDNHKLLVTCNSREQASQLYNDCSYAYKCFKNTSDDDWDINEFCREVESYDGDCVVFHCRKLIQGIDIKSITECLLFASPSNDNENNTKIVQTIGRALRTGKGERGMDFDNRTKKFANIYIMSSPNTQDYVEGVCNTIIKYYGIDNIIYNNGYMDGAFGSSPITGFDTKRKPTQPNYFEKLVCKVDEMKINFKTYLESKVIPIYKEIVFEGGILNLGDVIDMCDIRGLEDVNTMDLFTHTDKIKVVKDTFKQYNIEI